MVGGVQSDQTTDVPWGGDDYRALGYWRDLGGREGMRIEATQKGPLR